MAYKKRTESAESSALETKGLRETDSGSETDRSVNRSEPKSPRMLRLLTFTGRNGEHVGRSQWRSERT